MARKKIHIHLGPHKTGSSAIQKGLLENADLLQRKFGLTCIEQSRAARVAKHLNAERFEKAAQALETLATRCTDAPTDCIFSCEDLSGPLPGVRKNRSIYPHLWRNISLLREALGAFDCIFYFYIRPPDDWTKSAYIQNLKYRQRFNTLEAFTDALQVDELWDAIIATPADKLGGSFVTLDYSSAVRKSALKTLLDAVGTYTRKDLKVLSEVQANTSPSDDDVRLMEKINRSGASKEAKRNAKLSLFSEIADVATHQQILVPDSRYATPERPEDLPSALEPLWQRVARRVTTQDQPNLMPDTDADLEPYRHRIVESEGDLPEADRRYMINQAEILVYRFRDCPETCFLLGLAISYLRRDTPHTQHAALLFQRLWSEEYAMLLGLLPTRWLISSFQTFLEHGINEDQKVIGGAAYFYANMLKAYEAERALEGLPPDGVYPLTTPQTKSGFAGLDRFHLGGSDLLLNTNVLLLELSAKDQTAGRVVQEFLARVKASASIFSRMDKSRQSHRIDIKQFSNCWSFFEEP